MTSLMSFSGVSLLHGFLPAAVGVACAAGLVAGVARRGRRWWRVVVPRVVAASAAVVAVVAWYLRASGTVRDHYPPSFLVWSGAAVVAALVAVVGWRTARLGRKIVAVATVPLTVACAFLLVNAHYGYWPTVGDLFGRPVGHELSNSALEKLLDPTGATPAGLPTWSPPPWVPPDGTGASSVPVRIGGHRHVVGRAAGSHRTLSGPGLAGASLGPPVLSGIHGVTAALSIPGRSSGFSARTGLLYLPPAFFENPRPTLPVVVMLAGTPGAPDAWARGGAATATADAWAQHQLGVAPILAMVDANGSFTADTECVDGPQGDAETYLSVDVPRYLAQLLSIPVDPVRWAVVGFSEGGTCAFELALRHPDVYGSFVDLAGDWAPNLGDSASTLDTLYGGDEAAMSAHDPVTLLRGHRFGGTWGAIISGDADAHHVATAEKLAELARGAGITVTEGILPGAHNWQFAAVAFRRLFPAFATHLGAVAAPSTESALAASSKSASGSSASGSSTSGSSTSGSSASGSSASGSSASGSSASGSSASGSPASGSPASGSPGSGSSGSAPSGSAPPGSGSSGSGSSGSGSGPTPSTAASPTRVPGSI